MTEIEEGSKAIAEASKLGTKFLDSSDKLGGFLSNVFGPSIDNVIGLIGDKLEYMRWERQVRLVDKVNELSEKRGLKTFRPIPPKFAIPMIENASLEEDDDLQDIWCNLITNSLDSNFALEIRYAYIEIIKTLTSLDTKILKFVYDEVLKKSDSSATEISKISLGVESIKRCLSVSEGELFVSLNNLMRVQCLRNPSLENSLFASEGAFVFKTESEMQVALNPLGIAFIRTCME